MPSETPPKAPIANLPEYLDPHLDTLLPHLEKVLKGLAVHKLTFPNPTLSKTWALINSQPTKNEYVQQFTSLILQAREKDNAYATRIKEILSRGPLTVTLYKTEPNNPTKLIRHPSMTTGRVGLSVDDETFGISAILSPTKSIIPQKKKGKSIDAGANTWTPPYIGLGQDKSGNPTVRILMQTSLPRDNTPPQYEVWEITQEPSRDNNLGRKLPDPELLVNPKEGIKKIMQQFPEYTYANPEKNIDHLKALIQRHPSAVIRYSFSPDLRDISNPRSENFKIYNAFLQIFAEGGIFLLADSSRREKDISPIERCSIQDFTSLRGTPAIVGERIDQGHRSYVLIFMDSKNSTFEALIVDPDITITNPPPGQTSETFLQQISNMPEFIPIHPLVHKVGDKGHLDLRNPSLITSDDSPKDAQTAIPQELMKLLQGNQATIQFLEEDPTNPSILLTRGPAQHCTATISVSSSISGVTLETTSRGSLRKTVGGNQFFLNPRILKSRDPDQPALVIYGDNVSGNKHAALIVRGTAKAE